MVREPPRPAAQPEDEPALCRGARLARIRQYVKSNLVREQEEIDWADVSAKVKSLLDGRITGGLAATNRIGAR